MGVSFVSPKESKRRFFFSFFFFLLLCFLCFSLQKGYSFFFCLDTKEKEPKKKKSRAGACGATSSPLFADGAITRFAQTVAPSLRLTGIPLTPLRQGSFHATSLRSLLLFYCFIYPALQPCFIRSILSLLQFPSQNYSLPESQTTTQVPDEIQFTPTNNKDK